MMRFFTILLAVVLASAPGRGAAPTSTDSVAQAAAGQQQLRTTTQRVGEQLDAIIAEFGRNGIGGEDLQLLGTIRGVLSQLSEADMAHVMALLQDAREAGDPTRQRPSLVEAFGAQKSVSLKLRQILLEYQRQQELSVLAARLDELAGRVHTSMRETFSLANGASGRRRDWMTENQRISLQLQVSEQQSLRDELVSVVSRLQGWKDDRDNDAAARVARVLQQPEIGRLPKNVERVVADLNGGQLLSATGRQRELRDVLRRIAQRLLPPADELEALQNAVRQVEGLLARQEQLRTQTRDLDGRTAAPVEQATASLADLVDDTDVARQQTLELDSAASEQIAAAVGRMQEARGALDGPWKEVRNRRVNAGTQQEMAQTRLESAKRLLLQRIDTLEKQRQATTDPRSNLKQVRDEVADLLRRQKELKTETKAVEEDAARVRPFAPRQGDLRDQAEDTAERAALDSAKAAEELAEASSHMKRAQKSLGEGRNDPGEQQAAIDALEKALATLDADLAKLEAAQKELAELEDLLRRLLALIDSQKALNAETTRLARKLPGRTGPDLGRDQQGLSEATRKLEADLPASVPQAATYLADGATQMILAINELGASRAAEARPAQDEALENLLRARRELEDRLAQLREMLGLPPAEAPLDELAKLVKEAQQELNRALSAEELKKLAEGFKAATQKIKPATSGRMGRVPRMVQDPLQKAEQAMSEGDAAAESGEDTAASVEAGRAQEALAAAAAALDLAMAGMGQQPGQGEGQSGQGNQPGQGQGKGRGKTPGSMSGKGTGDAGNFFGSGGGDGPRRSASGSGKFIGLPARDRAALLQSQGEKYPQEYAPLIEQYLRNLSDQTESAPPK